MACLAAGPAPAQTTTLDTVTVTGRTALVLGVGGFGDMPLARQPLQASVLTTEQMRDRGITRLADVTRSDPAVSDAYNTEGYWDYLTIRGFVVDNRFNYRRDGLPISAETSIALDNKERIEILKGTSGMQAGTSAPGGLVNVVVKRPAATPLASARLEWRQPGSVLAAVDLGRRFGEAQAFGLRLNAAAERLDPPTRNARGGRHLLALAADWQLTPDALLEAEFETSHRSQPSAPGFSLLGSKLPAPGDPRLNLNNQPWSLPVVLEGNTASLRYTQKLNAAWRVTAHAATQQLTSQDRVAFPFGCFDPAPAPDGTYYADRYCPNGNFDLYDFRSESEHRRSDALELAAHGRFGTGGIGHVVSAGLLQTRVRNRFQPQAYNYVGSGNVDGTAITPADPSLTDQNTNRSERSTELFARDAIKLTERWTTWLGLRHTQLQRESVRTNGSRPTGYEQSFTTPWLAASFAVDGDTIAYASWGRGVESEVAPNRARYVNRGEALAALNSRQVELGLKGSLPSISWGLAWFDIEQPKFSDIPLAAKGCESDAPGDTCVHAIDGTARHRGLEANATWQGGPWQWQGGLQWLRARREGSATASINGTRPTNVPATTLKLLGRYDVAALPGLSLAGELRAEGDRMVLEDNRVRIPGYATLAASLRYATRNGGKGSGAELIWRAGIDNLADRRAWRESPLQFGHVYLFPLAPRSLRLSVEATL